MLKVPPFELVFYFALMAGGWLALCAIIYVVWTCYVKAGDANDAPWVNAVRQIVEDEATYPSTAAVDLPVEIMPHLLLGDKASAAKVDVLKAKGVTHVLNAAGRAGRDVATYRAYREAGIETESIDEAEDEEGYPLVYTHQPFASEFINKAKAAGGVCLIHCIAGINRSGTLAAAELMLHERLPVLEAVRRVKQARRVVMSNHSFQAQLVALARTRGLLGDRPDASDKLTNRPARKPAQQALKKVM